MQSKKPNKSSSGDNPKTDVNERIHKALGVKPYKGQKSDNATEVKRFIESLNQAMVMHQISQRKLGNEMGVSIGTITKYLRGEVNPFDVRTRITRNLAGLLGITPDALFDYYDTGEYKNTLTIKDVESWIRSTSETKDLPRILAALSASQKNIQKQEPEEKKEKVVTPPPVPTAKELKKFGSLLVEHLQTIRKYEVLNTREVWQLFTAQDYAKGIKQDDLDDVQDILTGEIPVTAKIIERFGGAYGRCPVIATFRAMSKAPMTDELVALQDKIENSVCYKLTGQLQKQISS